MTAMVECEGIPRDLGRDQAAALAQQVQSAAAGSALRRLADRVGGFDRASQRWLRDVRRHFPHQGEWIEGLARAARVPDLALVRAMRAALVADLSALAIGVVGKSGIRIARTAPPGAVLRRSRPEGRFASVEVGSAVLCSPWIGVNEAGLAVAVVGGVESTGSFAASAALLVRDCLERFDAVESALAWCMGRPAASGASILLADSAGELAGVELRAEGRRVAWPQGGALLLTGGTRQGGALLLTGGTRQGGALLLTGGTRDVASLEKSLAAACPVSADFEAILGAVLDESAARAAIRIDPVRRILRPDQAGRDLLPVASD